MKYIRLFEQNVQHSYFKHLCKFIETDEYTEFTINNVEKYCEEVLQKKAVNFLLYRVFKINLKKY